MGAGPAFRILIRRCAVLPLPARLPFLNIKTNELLFIYCYCFFLLVYIQCFRRVLSFSLSVSVCPLLSCRENNEEER